jgi:MYXO-CTERM domain-containing protein
MIPNRLFAACALFAVVWHSAPALAGDVFCPPGIGAVTIDGNVLVAAPCRLDGTTVKGNVLLYAGGSLVTRGAVRIDGNIQAERSDFVDVEGAFVNGSIQLKELVGDRSKIVGTRVVGSIQLDANRGRLEVRSNQVNGDVQAFDNKGGVVIDDNTIEGNLQCKTNNPAPAGGNNRVRGNREDQCANLQPEGSTPASAPQVSTPAPVLSSVTPTSSQGGGGGRIDLTLLALLGAGLALAWRRRSEGLR